MAFTLPLLIKSRPTPIRFISLAWSFLYFLNSGEYRDFAKGFNPFVKNLVAPSAITNLPISDKEEMSTSPNILTTLYCLICL